ncbi:uncharacterized protein LOC141665406 [Apium graveolens]|uniref:uncharacterized protein LOC141665406 n=1 Tax=Apium graveolens TaxID=4045 RepID=UPI003D79321B
MDALLRTTSRSESLNLFFQHFHESSDTLVEFYSSFESAMDKQCLRQADDEKRSENIPLTDTSMAIKKDASKLHTLELYHRVMEEIKTGFNHTSMTNMSRDDQSRKGYSCHHAFAASHQCCVKKIPDAFVKPHWSKNALKRHSFLGSSQVKDICEDEDKLDSVLNGVHEINTALTKDKEKTPLEGGSHRADKFIAHVPLLDINVLNPNMSRNKGCGSRIKSAQEIATETVK